MDYQQAIKQVRAEKKKPGYLVISFGYDKTFVLPHEDAIKMLSALEKAEHMSERYGDKAKLTPLKREAFDVFPMSAEQYELTKVAQLLNVSVSDLTTLEST